MSLWEGNPRQYHIGGAENGKESNRIYQITDSGW